jgi:hypothetical protein
MDLSSLEGLQNGKEGGGQGTRPTTVSIHVDMNKMTAGGARLIQPAIVGKQGDLIAHAGCTDATNTQSRQHRLRVGQRRKVVALGLYHQSDQVPRMDVKYTAIDQVPIDRRVKPAVVDDVVDMPVNVVV